ncbi:N-acetyltransferase [Morganella morganii]|uniref:GNAT family N-acetyltransferase n=1 Tax=Morganella morganii TaxID=582 RepID=UPI0015F3887A|nr:GNAT family N-acetyltransferase [Morganella morganii]MBA5808581.1 N-acetyltransferase [Morganella morganii]
MIHYRQMENTDCGKVAALLQENAQSRQGGLSGEYPLKKVEAMFAHALTVIIAQDDDVIAGVVFSFPVQSAQISPVTALISQQFGELLENNWFYGPVCIAKDYRGQGILSALYKQVCAENSGKPVAFINQDNERSVRAHLKSGMREAGHFICNETPYFLMIGR